MIFVQKLPTLEPEMREALRNHILRKRQRLKQELEQDAIEKRLKKEKELKQVQDAMTLDQIKDQLSTLEKKLETLRDEKHGLFVQLKQVLNEDNNRRKQIETERKLKSRNEPTLDSASAYQTDALANDAINDLGGSTNHIDRLPINSTVILDSRAQEFRPINRQATGSAKSNISPPAVHGLSKPITLTRAEQSKSIVGSPILPIHSTYSTSTFNRVPINATGTDIHQLYKPPNIIGQAIPEHPNPRLSLDFAQQRFLNLHPDHHRNPILLDSALSLATNYQDNQRNLNVGNKRSSNAANLSEPSSSTRKKPHNFSYPNQNPYFASNQLQNSALINLSQFDHMERARSMQSTSLETSQVPTPHTSNIYSNHYQSRRSSGHHLPPNFDFLTNRNKRPGMVVTGLSSLYAAQSSSMIPPSQIYPVPETDLKHFATPYPALQQYGNTSRNLNSQNHHSDQSSRYFSPSMNNYHRKYQSNKHSYQHK